MRSLKKLLYFLDSKEKKNLYLLIVLIVFISLIDVAGISSIFPFISLIANPNIIETNSLMSAVYNKSLDLGINSQDQFFFVFGLFFISIFILSIIGRIILSYSINKFGLMREYSIGKKIINIYLSQNYLWFLKKNTSDIGKSILSEVALIINDCLLPLLSLVSQSITILAIITLLVYVDPKTAVTAFLMIGVCYLSIFFLVKKKLSELGSQRLESNSKRFLAINETFAAIKEIKISNLEKKCSELFLNPAKEYSKKLTLATAISILPRYFLEIIAVVGIVAFLLVLLSSGKSFAESAPILSLFAFAGYRLMPSFQQIYNAVTKIKFSQPALNNLYDEIILLEKEKIKNHNIEKLNFQNKVCLEKISFKYPNQTHYILKNLSLEIPKNYKIAIIGSSGSGKTSVVDLLLGLIKPQKGTVMIDNNILDDDNLAYWQKNIGYVPQQIFISDNTIEKNIAFNFNNEPIDLKRLVNASKIAQLHDFVVKELPDGYNTFVGEGGSRLSGGQRQRLGIARAIYKNPKLLVFDEATNALDGFTEKQIINNLSKISNLTLIMITHRIKSIKEFNKFYYLSNSSVTTSNDYDELCNKSLDFSKLSKLD